MKNQYVFVLASLLLAAPVLAQAPREFNYQGKLALPDGTPSSTPHTFRFRVYPNVGGTGGALYDGTAAGVTVTNGVFNVVLGRDTAVLPANLFQNTDLWMRVSVDGTDLTPLQKLTASPFALAVAQDSVGSAEVVNDSLMDADVAAAADITPAKINGGSFQNEEYNFPSFLGIGVPNPAYRLDVAGDINLTGQLRVNGNPAVFSNWTVVGGGSIARNSSVTINSTADPQYPLDVYGNVNIRSGSLFIDGTPAIFSKWSDAPAASGVYRATNVGVGGTPGGALAYKLHVFDTDAANTIGITQGGNTGELKVGYVAAAPAGYYAVYAP